MMVNESDEILIAQKTDVPIEDEDSDAENLGNLFSISAELISNINASSIDNSLGSDYTIFRDGDVLLTEEKIVVAGPQFGTNIFAFRDSYLSKSANIFGQTWGLSVDETLLLDGAFIHCAKSTNPFGSVVIPIGDVTDLECVFLVASEWPDPSAGTTTCEFLAGFATIYNWLGDDDGPITESEIALINEHCFCASEIALNAAKAILMSKNVFPGAISRNNCQDAFRHTFWNALNAQSLACGLTLAIEFADAHEEGQPMNNNWFMDEHNNTVGQIIGDENPLVFGAAMANLVCEELELGNGIILLQDGVPTVAVPDTNPIDESDSCDCQ